MPTFRSEDIEIAYDVYGAGAPIVCVHGFASNGKVNWLDTSWVETLTGAGYQVVTLDNRGHGRSEKLYDGERYSARAMARDVINLIDHLNLGSVAVMGYSMGARISTFVAIDAPEKVSAVILGGMGMNLIHGMRDSDEIVKALLAPSLDAVTDKTGRQFRIFAEHTGSDLKALAACMGSSRVPITEEQVRGVEAPVLVALGSKDYDGDPQALADLMPQGEALVIEGRDHMRATGDPQFKTGVLAFLSRVY